MLKTHISQYSNYLLHPRQDREAIAAPAPTMPNMKDFYSVSEVASLLKVHPVTVRLYAASGKIPGRQIGNRWRFSREAIETWLSGNEKSPA